MSITLSDTESILKRLYDDNQDVWVYAQADAIELIEKQAAEIADLMASIEIYHATLRKTEAQHAPKPEPKGYALVSTDGREQKIVADFLSPANQIHSDGIRISVEQFPIICVEER